MTSALDFGDEQRYEQNVNKARSEASLMHGLAQLAGAQGRRFQGLRVIRMKDPHELRPGNRHLREAEARRTLGELIHRKTALIAICHRCKHRRLLFPSALAAQLGATFKVIDLPKRLRCGACRGYGTANVHEASR